VTESRRPTWRVVSTAPNKRKENKAKKKEKKQMLQEKKRKTKGND